MAARPPVRQAHTRSFSPAQSSQAASSGLSGLGGRLQKAREPAHLPLHRRLLFPTYPAEKALPPIILAEGKQASSELLELNGRIYHLIALTLRAYVLSWYPRFSKDRTFLPTLTTRIVVPLLSPILTELYRDPERLIRFILLDLPSILYLYLSTYWQARQAISLNPHLFISDQWTADPSKPSGSGSGFDIALGQAYHARLPLLSVTPSPGSTEAEKESYPYRQPTVLGQYVLSPLYLTALSDALLRLHLPVEEYASGVERTMAREIVARAVLGAVGRRIGEGWFWWSLILRFLPSSPSGRAAHREQDIALAKGTGKEWYHPSLLVHRAMDIFQKIWSLGLLLWTFGTSLLARYSAAPPIQERYRNCLKPWLALGRELLGVDGRQGNAPTRWVVRFSWATFEAAMILLGPLIDRLAPHILRSSLTISSAHRILDLLERILFPLDGYPGPSPADLTPVEAKAVRVEVEQKLTNIIPRQLTSCYPASRRASAVPLEVIDAGEARFAGAAAK